MKYKELLTHLLNIDNLEYNFCISESEAKKYYKYNKNDVLSALAFVPVKYSEKKRIFDSLLNSEIKQTIQLVSNIERVNDHFISNDKNQSKKIEEYIDYLYDWMLVITNNNITLQTVKFIKNRVKTVNYLFWFFLVKKIYGQKKYEEYIYLVKYIKKEYIKRDNFLYSELSFYELISLKKSVDYISDSKSRSKICKFVKEITFDDYEKIITRFECALFDSNKDKFNRIFYKHHSKILNWNIVSILNLYELAIYLNDDKIMQEIYIILKIKDIALYKGEYEYDNFMFLEAVRMNNMKEIYYYKNKMKNRFDFRHFEWFRRG